MTMDISFFLPIFLSFVLVAIFIPLASRAAPSLGLVDKPGGRKHHKGDIPLIGGLVIFVVFLLVVGLFAFDFANLWPLFLSLLILLVVGGLDDRQEIRPWFKFTAQILAACLVVLPGHAQLSHLGDLFGLGIFDLGFMAIPFSLAAVTLLINAMNLMDGLDGLTAGKGAVIMAWLCVAAFFAGQMILFQQILIVLAALAAFLIFNMRHPFRDKASVFLGDSGSLCLGLVIAWYSISLAKEPASAIEPIAVAWVLALPIMDTCAQFYRRTREGRHPFSPDRAHFHHHFIEAGIPVHRATLLILTIGIVLGGVGYIGAAVGVPLLILTSLWIICLLGHMAISSKPAIYVAIIKALRVDKKDSPRAAD